MSRIVASGRVLTAGKGFLFSDRGEVVLRGLEDPGAGVRGEVAGGGLMEPRIRYAR